MIVVGYTKSAMPEYSSFADGYRAEAEQVLLPLELGDFEHYDGETICEAVFVATNAPSTQPGSLADVVRAAVDATGYRGESAHYSLSTGDTVWVRGTLYECVSMGWRVVARGVQLPQTVVR